MQDKLTIKQKIFADEYLIDFNATRAYKIAYPSVKKEETAAQAGSRMLRNVKVKKYLEAKTKEFEKTAKVTKDQVLQEFVNIAFADITDLVEIKGSSVIVQDINAVPKELKRAIASVKETKYGLEIKFHDKVRALENLGRHLGMYVDKVEHSGNISNPILESINKQLMNRNKQNE